MRTHGYFSGPYFPLFGLNMEICYINLRVQSEYRKYGQEKTPYLGVFYTVPSCSIYSNGNFNVPKQPLIVVLQNSCSENFLKFHRKVPAMEIFLVKLQTQECYFSKNISITIVFMFLNFQNNFFIEHSHTTASAT